MIQAGKPVAVWGWAAAGEEVSVSFAATNGKSDHVTAKAGADGRWSAQLSAVPDGTAGEIEVRTKTEGPIKVADVLAGEVWLCGGQSNMSYLLTTTGRIANESTGPEILAEAQANATAANGACRTTPTAASTSDTNDKGGMGEQLGLIVFRKMGMPAMNRRYIHMFVNGTQRSSTTTSPRQPRAACPCWFSMPGSMPGTCST